MLHDKMNKQSRCFFLTSPKNYITLVHGIEVLRQYVFQCSLIDHFTGKTPTEINKDYQCIAMVPYDCSHRLLDNHT